jgi:hypothetical protein
MLPQFSENGLHLNNERVSASLGSRPYLVVEGTLDECIREFMSNVVAVRNTSASAERGLIVEQDARV